MALLRLLTKEISLLEHVDVISSSLIHSTYMHLAFMSLLFKPKTHDASKAHDSHDMHYNRMPYLLVVCSLQRITSKFLNELQLFECVTIPVLKMAHQDFICHGFS